jgi:hypothetical protein
MYSAVALTSQNVVLSGDGGGGGDRQYGTISGSLSLGPLNLL